MSQFPAPPRAGLVVEDLPETRQWLTGVLEQAFPGIEVTAADSIGAALAELGRRVPDVALVDLGLPDGSGVDLIAKLGVEHSACATIVTTIYADDDHLFSALRAGAQGYLLKDQARERLAEQLQGILRGEPPLSPAIARRLMRAFSASGGAQLEAKPEPLDESGLTAREIEVLTLIARGHTLKDVGKALAISRFTVGDHVKMIYRKLNVASRAEAALQAARLGIVRDD